MSKRLLLVPVYTALWIASLLVAIAFFARNPRAYAIAQPGYFRMLGRPWRIVTFVVAAAGLALVAPCTGDPTWDRCDALLMSVLTYVTAPWVMGTVYRVRRVPVRELFVAANAWLFSASWSYDGYILLRDGNYPPSWRFNLLASSVLYVAAGLFWSLDYEQGRGIVFAFMHAGWPTAREHGTFLRLAPVAALFMGLVTAMVGYFLWTYFR